MPPDPPKCAMGLCPQHNCPPSQQCNPPLGEAAYGPVMVMGVLHSIIFTWHTHIHRLLLLPVGQHLDVSQLDISQIKTVMPELGPITTHHFSMILLLKCHIQ